MTNKVTMTICPACGGTVKKDKTLFSVEIDSGILIIKDVPVETCSQCGEKWFPDDVMERLEIMAGDVRKRHTLFEVMLYSAA